MMTIKRFPILNQDRISCASMTFDSTRKKASSTTIVYVVFLLLMFITVMTSLCWLENQHQLTPQDYDRSKELMLEMAPGPDPQMITCNRSNFRYDLCSINGPSVLDPTEATLYSTGPTRSFEKVKPYARKWENNTMAKIREVKLITSPIVGTKCDVHHNSHALIFSAGGLTGNFFHDFNDGFLPLYITLNSLSMVDRNVVLVVDGARDWWIHKYVDIIHAFTKHPIINLEKENSTHCFTRASVGLISHGFMTLDPNSLGPLTLSHFHSFIRNAFYTHQLSQRLGSRPKLVWMNRAGSVGRVILNQAQAREVAEEVGFDVVIYSPKRSSSLRDAYELINASHAMIGVHGAAMTHMLFLRKGSVAVQVIPLGLEWVGKVCFGQAARDVGLEYMEYKIGYNESSLSSKYEKENPIVKDAKKLQKGWVQELMNVYLKEQDVSLDLVRFRVYMEEVYKKAKRFMDKHG